MSTATDTSCVVGAASSMLYESQNTAPMISFNKTLFKYTQHKISPLAIFSMKLKSTAGNSVSFADDITTNLKRGGDYLMGTFSVVEAPGIYSHYSAGTSGADDSASGALVDRVLGVIPTGSDAGTAGTAQADAADAQAYFGPYWGIFAHRKVVLNLSTSAIASLSDEWMLCREELLGAAGKSSAALTGKYGSVAEAQDRSQRKQTAIVPLSFFWTQDIGFSMPMALLAWNTMSIVCTMRAINDLLIKPSVTCTLVAGAAVTTPAAESNIWDSADMAVSKRAEGTSLGAQTIGAAALADADMVSYKLLCMFAWVAKSERAAMHASTYKQQCVFQYTQRTTITQSAAPTEDVEEQHLRLNCAQAVTALFLVPRMASNKTAKAWSQLAGPAVTVNEGSASGEDGAHRHHIIKKFRLEINHSARQDLTSYELYDLGPHLFCSTSSSLDIGVCSFSNSIASEQFQGWLNFAKIDHVDAYFSLAKEAFPSTSLSVEIAVVAAYLNTVKYRHTHLTTEWLNQS